MKKTMDMKWNNLIRNTKKSVPYCDPNKGVMWGSDKDNHKSVKTK